MQALSIDQIASMTGGEIAIKGKSDTVTSVEVDSRKTNEGSLFFALPGTSLDGHQFVKKAAENGASAAVVERVIEDANLYQIKVDDTYRALYALAGGYKEMFDIPFIALTGSAGKTSTKDMIASVLSRKYKTMKTIGNYNSTTGVPLTLFNLDKSHELAVIEMGMNHKGEIEQLSALVKPDFAIITNVGVTHIENLGSRENIFKAKMEITSGLKKDGVLLVNADNDLFTDLEIDEYDLEKIGIDNGNFRAYDVDYGLESVSFKVVHDGQVFSFTVTPPAKYSIYNALIAIFTGFYFGLDYEQITKGLDDFVPSANRMDKSEVRGMTLINDTYNSNPDALKQAIDMLVNVSGRRRKVAVLGDMFELGQKAAQEHFSCGKHAAKKGIDLLLLAGTNSLDMKKGALEGGMKEEDIVYFEDKKDLLNNLLSYLKHSDVILFKASRGMAFEELVDKVKKGE